MKYNKLIAKKIARMMSEKDETLWLKGQTNPLMSFLVELSLRS